MSPPDSGAPVRRVRLDRMEALFEAWRALDAITAPEAAGLERALLAALARDRELYSDVLEASFAIGPRGERAYRFSYAFPGFRGAPSSSSAAVASALACAAPFGPAIVAATRRLLRAATDPAVEQPLVGLAWDRAGAPRHKVYLQFRDAAGPAAAALSERVLGIPGLAARIGDARLHMLGVDFGPAGLSGAKLYIAHASVIASEPAAAAPAPLDIASALARALPAGHRVRNVLAVHRLGSSDCAVGGLPPASDVDFGLADNDLTWDALARAPTLASILARSRLPSTLFSAFRIGVRRLSIGTGVAPGATVYYALREVEAAS